MCVLKKTTRFIIDGVSTLREASRGLYDKESEAVSDIRDEIFNRRSSLSDDKKNLMSDKSNVSKDVRKSFNDLILENG